MSDDREARYYGAIVDTTWPDGMRLDGITRITGEMIAERVLAVADAEQADLRAEADRFRRIQFEPLGDNHHNAALCPYCGDLIGKVERQRDDALAEVDRLRAGEDPTPRDENAWPTPGQFIREWNNMGPAERLDAAEKITKGAQDHLDLLIQIATLREPTIAHFRDHAEKAEAALREARTEGDDRG